MMIGVTFGVMGVFFLAGLYVAAALGATALLVMWLFSDAPLWDVLASLAWTTNTSFIVLAIPLFILMGELMNRGGVGERMYSVISRWITFLPGGLLHTNIVACTIFSACSGSSVATSATISRVSLPTFKARGYNESLVVGSLASGGTLGILIPPSIAFILYGVLVEESIGRLYMAGLFPGIMLAGLFMLMILFLSLVWKNMAPREAGIRLLDLEEWRIRIVSLLAMLPVFALIFLVLGTIYMGIATPSEAAAFGVAGAFVLVFLLNSERVWKPLLARTLVRAGLAPLLPAELRAQVQQMQPLDHRAVRDTIRLTLSLVNDAIMGTIRVTGMIMLILLAAVTISFAFARLGISDQIAQWITAMNLSPVAFLIMIALFFIVLGAFMEAFAMLVTTVPILLPTLIAMNIDLVWFGVIMVILIEAALISPPHGINLYVLHGVRQDVDRQLAQARGVAPPPSTIRDVWVGVLPFLFCMTVGAILVILFPEIALWLPNQLMGARL